MPINTTKHKISLNLTNETSLTCFEMHDLKTGASQLLSAATGDKTEPESTSNIAPQIVIPLALCWHQHNASGMHTQTGHTHSLARTTHPSTFKNSMLQQELGQNKYRQHCSCCTEHVNKRHASRSYSQMRPPLTVI